MNLVKLGIEKVVPLLPEVGDPLLAQAREINGLLDQVAALKALIEMKQEILEEAVDSKWSLGEILKARKQAAVKAVAK